MHHSFSSTELYEPVQHVVFIANKRQCGIIAHRTLEQLANDQQMRWLYRLHYQCIQIVFICFLKI